MERPPDQKRPTMNRLRRVLTVVCLLSSCSLIALLIIRAINLLHSSHQAQISSRSKGESARGAANQWLVFEPRGRWLKLRGDNAADYDDIVGDSGDDDDGRATELLAKQSISRDKTATTMGQQQPPLVASSSTKFDSIDQISRNHVGHSMTTARKNATTTGLNTPTRSGRALKRRRRLASAESMRFLLMCQVLDGEPPVRVKWFKDGVELSETSGGHLDLAASDQVELIGNEELGASLLFRRVQQQHSGNYTCLASNRHGTSSYSSTMSVKVPPKWRVEPEDKESIIGEQISIDCQATGSPNPFIRWKFTGGNNLSQQQQHMLANAVRAIDSAGLPNHHAESAGLSLQVGQATSTAVAAVVAADLQVQAAESVAASQQSFGFKLINSNHFVQTLENGSLAIRQTSKEHEGYYLCEADNGLEPLLVKTVRLIVHQQAQIPNDIQLDDSDAKTSASTNINSPSDSLLTHHHHQHPPAPSPVVAKPSSSSSSPTTAAVFRLVQNATLVRLLCQPIGELPLTLDWLKDGQLVYTHSSTSAPGASVGADLSSSSAALQPQQQQHYPPVMSQPSYLSRSSQQQQSILNSSKGRYRVDTRRSPTRPLAGIESELIISNLNRLDAGLFTCVARNAYGRAERAARIIVQEPPESPEMVDVGHIGSRSIGLRWLAPFDGNSPIVKYTVEYRKHPPEYANEPTNATGPFTSSPTATGRSDKLMPYKSVQTGLPEIQASASGQQAQQIQHTVHDLEPLARYTMRVIAVNAVGQSRPSVALSLRTEEEVPSVVPTLVEANVLSSRSIKLRWAVSYAPEREIIEGFFVGYRSLDTQQQQVDSNNLDKQPTASGEQPTFTYKTIRLTNQQQQQSDNQRQPELVLDGRLNSSSQRHPIGGLQDQSALLSPVSFVTKSIPAASTNPFTLGLIGHMQQQPHQSAAEGGGPRSLVVVSTFEYVIGGLERNTEYSILIQCFNKKGAGPASDPIVFKTLATDPPEKLILNADEITESSLRLSWRFLNEFPANKQPEPVDGFVLSFSRATASSPSLKSWPATKEGPYLTESIIEQQQQQQARSLDPAARISQSNPTLAANSAQPDQWQAIQLAPQQRSHQLKNLECGSAYSMKIWAFNKVGHGEASDVLTISTRGKAPVAPDRRSFISVNSTQVRLHLSAWYDGGCELDRFIVQYRPRGQQQDWILVSNNILREQMSVVIRDLAPATAYELLVTAFNQVGPTEVRYRFTTLDADGKPVTPSLFDMSESDPEHTADQDASARRETWPGYGQDSGWRNTILLLKQLLNSPFTLFLALILFVMLFVSLLFHRFSSNQSGGSSTGTLTCSNKSSRGEGHGGICLDGAGDRRSPNELGGTASLVMDRDGQLGGPMDGTPRLHGGNMSRLSHGLYGYALSTGATTTNGVGADSICGASSIQPTLGENCGGAQYMDASAAYGPIAQNNQGGFYGHTGDYARSNVIDRGADPNVQPDPTEQQCLMQMLLMNANQQQQPPDSDDLNHPSQSYVAAALTTLARNKSKLITSSSMQHTSNHGANYSSSTLGHATLGRQLVDCPRLQQHQPPGINCSFPEQNPSMIELRSVAFGRSSNSDSNATEWSTSGHGSGSTRSSMVTTTTTTNHQTVSCDEKQYEVPFKPTIGPSTNRTVVAIVDESAPAEQDESKTLVYY